MLEKSAKYLRQKRTYLRAHRGDPAQPGNSPGSLHRDILGALHRRPVTLLVMAMIG